MEGIRDVEGVQEFKLRWPLRISYYAVGLIGACCDSLFIVISSIILDLIYRFFLREANDITGTALGAGFVVAILFNLLGKVFDLYKLTYLLTPSKQISKILVTWTSSILLLTAMLFLLRAGTSFSRGSTTIFALSAPVPLILVRLVVARVLLHLIAQGAIGGCRVVIIGEEIELAQLSAPFLLIDFGLTEVARISFRDGSKLGLLSNEDLAKLDDAIAIARQKSAEELVIAFDWSRGELIQGIEQRLRLSPLPVRLLPDRAARSVFGRGSLSVNGSIASIELQRAPLTHLERLAKRVCDVTLGTMALVLLAPLMLLTVLAIKLDSAGPAIFRQRRIGFNGRMFSIYKFRTMSVMEDGPEIIQTRRVDPRVTKVGRLLRQSSIDELPQLVNVLLGDMSLIGPRPHAVAHDDQYGAAISSYAYRHHVKPGITGWAQVNGERGETRRIEDMEKRIDLDLWYINNWSLLLDCRIIWRTCFELLRYRAY